MSFARVSYWCREILEIEEGISEPCRPRNAICIIVVMNLKVLGSSSQTSGRRLNEHSSHGDDNRSEGLHLVPGHTEIGMERVKSGRITILIGP